MTLNNTMCCVPYPVLRLQSPVHHLNKEKISCDTISFQHTVWKTARYLKGHVGEAVKDGRYWKVAIISLGPTTLSRVGVALGTVVLLCCLHLQDFYCMSAPWPHPLWITLTLRCVAQLLLQGSWQFDCLNVFLYILQRQTHNPQLLLLVCIKKKLYIKLLSQVSC